MLPASVRPQQLNAGVSLVPLSPMVMLSTTNDVHEEPFAKERASILGDIDMILRTAADLKTRLNTFTLIGRLPTEVLAHILVRYVEIFWASCPWSLKWIRVTHVCRHWKAVALNTPRFWSHLHSIHPEAFSALMARSKSAPLFLNLSFRLHDSRDPILGTVLQDSHRIQELLLVTDYEKLRRFCEDLVQPLSLLQRLTFMADHDYDNVSSAFPILPSTGYTPRLRYLKLQNIPFLWSDHVFCSTITTLIVVARDKRDAHNAPGSFEQLVTVLEAMAPRLANLTLDQSIPCLPTNTAEPPPTSRTIPFPSLVSLRLVGNANDCAHLFNYMSINPAATVYLGAGGGTGIKDLVRGLSNHVGRSEPLHAVCVRFPSHRKPEILGWKSLQMSGDAPIHFLRDGVASSENLLDYVLQEDAPLFSHVRRLQVNCDGWEFDWARLFRSMPRLRILEVNDHPVGDFFDALCDVPSTPELQPRACVPLIRLHTLRMADVRFRNSSKWVETEFVEELLDWTILRCNYGVPLRRLKLSACTNSEEEDIDLLKEIVVDVSWDEWERESTDDEGSYSSRHHNPYLDLLIQENNRNKRMYYWGMCGGGS